MIASHGSRLHVAGDVVRKTVLIVKDKAPLRRAISELFKAKGDFDVCEVGENGPEAIEVKVDCILT